MIRIILSERDFDYEIQALTASFFSGRSIRVVSADEEELKGSQKNTAFYESAELEICINLSMDKVFVSVKTNKFETSDEEFVTGSEDWHKHDGKTAHPYRTYYKNVLKKLIFVMLRDFPDDMLPEGFVRRIPAWGTMTGVRPVKIAMNEILSGCDGDMVRKSLEEVYCCSQDKAELGVQIAMREAKLLRKAEFESGYSLYIGIPFCPTTCLYCSFTSYPYEKFGHMADAYLKALKKEIKYSSQIFKDKKLTSIYIGGGTPTTLSPDLIRELMTCIRTYFPVDDSLEFTVEAGRPDSITREKLAVLREFGVERISVNPQTMQQKTLEIIGRRHTVRQTIEAFNLAREMGFTNINMDLIIGLPGESEEDFKNTLMQIERLNPESLTIHSLVVKRASGLRSVLEESWDEDDIRKPELMERMLFIGHEFAREHRYLPYYMYRQKNSAGHMGSTGQENIGYARDGKECLYNILIMEEKQTILALGAGASTKLYHNEFGQVSRIENVKSVTDYIERIDEMIERKSNLAGEI